MIISAIIRLFSKIFFLTGRVGGYNAFLKPLSSEEEKECFKKIKEGDKEALDKLVSHNLRLVAHIVKKFNYKNFDQDELISVGSYGLLKAAKTYDPEKGHSFSTYGARCIENEILMFLRSQRKFQNEVSFEDKIKSDKDGNEVSLIDVLEDQTSRVQEETETKLLFENLVSIIDKTLNDREKQVIYMRYGIMGYQAKTQNEVAEELGISRSYISRIEKKAMETLRDNSKDLL